MLILSRADVEAVLELDALRRAVGDALSDVSAGRASMPPRIAARVDEPEGLLGAMPAYLPALSGLGTKLVSLFPGNAGGPLPTHQAVILLFDAANGQPIALMDGTHITAVRTAAASALSVEHLARPGARILALLGSGVQARAHADAVVRVRDFTEIRVAGRTREHAERLVAELSTRLQSPVHAVSTYAEACSGADVICACTHAAEPVVTSEHVTDGTHITSVGYNIAGREVDAETVRRSLLVVESRAAVLAAPPAGANDIRLPIEAGLITADHIHAELGEIVAGTRPGRTSAAQVTLYKSVGIAAEDVAAASLALSEARRAGLGVEVVI